MSCPRKAPTGTAPGPALSMVNVPTEAPTARATDAMSPTAMAPRLRLPGLAKSPGDAVPVPSAATIPWASSAATTPSGARVRSGVDLSEWLMAGLEEDHPSEQDKDEDWDLQDDIHVAD